MIHEERVALMTKMQAYEDRGGKSDIAIASYFRGDYIGLQILKSIVHMTIVACIIYAGHLFYNLEDFLKDMYQMDWLEYAKTLATDYLILVMVYAVITYLIYAYRYTKAKKSLKKYYGRLKRLNAMYSKEP